MNRRLSALILLSSGFFLAGGLSAQEVVQELTQPLVAPTQYLGWVNINMGIQLGETLPSGDSVYCETTISTFDPVTGDFSESIIAPATMHTASSYSCATLTAYNWALSAPTTDKISIVCSVYFVGTSTTVKAYDRVSSWSNPSNGIAVPTNGGSVTFTCPYPIKI